MDTMNDELWRVQLSTGEIRTMTLEALDQAFEDGVIDARVPVLPPGASAWTTLGAAAGLDDGSVTEETPSLSPIAISMSAASSSEVPTEPDTKPSLDLDLPDAFDELRPRRARGLVIGGAVGAAVLAAVVAVFAGDLASSAPVAADVKAAAAVAVEAPPPAAAAETLPPPAAKEAAPPKEDAKPNEDAKPKEDAKPELSDWQKRMLVDADKAREEKARAKSQERADKPAPPKPQQKAAPTRTNGLLNGGDKFDPLNGAL